MYVCMYVAMYVYMYVCMYVCLSVCLSVPFSSLRFLTMMEFFTQYINQQPFLACRQMWKNDTHDQPPLSVHLAISPSVRQSVHPTIKDFTHGNDFWCAGSWDSHKEKSDPYDHLCQSVCLSVCPSTPLPTCAIHIYVFLFFFFYF